MSFFFVTCSCCRRRRRRRRPPPPPSRLAFLRFTPKLGETVPFRRWLRIEPAFALLTPGERAEFTVSVFVDRLTARVSAVVALGEWLMCPVYALRCEFLPWKPRTFHVPYVCTAAEASDYHIMFTWCFFFFNFVEIGGMLGFATSSPPPPTFGCVRFQVWRPIKRIGRDALLWFVLNEFFFFFLKRRYPMDPGFHLQPACFCMMGHLHTILLLTCFVLGKGAFIFWWHVQC